MKRKDELTHEIEKISERIAHLTAQAAQVEKGTDEWSAKTREGNEVERTDTHKINHTEAVSYWREARENENRREELRSELRKLEAGIAEPIDVAIRFDGPDEPEEETVLGVRC